MKKTLALLLAFLLVFSLSACGKKPASEPPSPATPAVAAVQTPEPAVETEAPEETEPEEPETETSDKQIASEPAASPLAEAEVAPDDSEARIALLKGIVKDYLDSESYIFNYDENMEAFIGDFALNSPINRCTVLIYLYDDMVAVRAVPIDWLVPEATRDNVAIYITRANNDNFYAFFMMDYEDGFISVRSSHIVEKVLPTQKEIDVLVSETLWMLEDYSAGLVEVATNNADPHETYDAIVFE